MSDFFPNARRLRLVSSLTDEQMKEASMQQRLMEQAFRGAPFSRNQVDLTMTIDDEEAEKAVLRTARDHAVAKVGPSKGAVVEFEHNGRRWVTRWGFDEPNPFIGWTWPVHKPTKRHLVT